MLFLALALSYFCGSIPFGVLIARARGIDLRAVGSGNIGATNAWRALGRGLGSAVFALDVLKGLAAPWIARALLGHQAEWGIALCAVMAVIGHTFSIFLKGKGGKGIATGLGTILGLSPIVGLGGFVFWGLVSLLTRTISIASIAACFAIVLGALIARLPVPYTVGITMIGVLALLKHIPNMKRLAAGTEPKIGQAKPHESVPEIPATSKL